MKFSKVKALATTGATAIYLGLMNAQVVLAAYTLKDFGYAALAGLVGLIFIAIPPYGLILVLIKIVIVVLAMTIVMAKTTIRPVAARKNIKVRDNFKLKRRYANGQWPYPCPAQS